MPVSPDRGNLVLEYPNKSSEDVITYAFHGGCFTYPGLLGSGAPGSTRTDRGRMLEETVAGVEPGEYAICAPKLNAVASWEGKTPPSTPCDSGTLPSGGTLKLTVP